MNGEELEAVKEALDRQMRKESFEHALGKVMRRRNLAYENYVQTISEIRELANRKRIQVEDAARSLTTLDKE